MRSCLSPLRSVQGCLRANIRAGIRSFLSPTVVHFSSVLIICLLATIPTETWAVLGVLLTCGGAIGLAYSGWVWRRMMRHGIIATIDFVEPSLVRAAAYRDLPAGHRGRSKPLEAIRGRPQHSRISAHRAVAHRYQELLGYDRVGHGPSAPLSIPLSPASVAKDNVRQKIASEA